LFDIIEFFDDFKYLIKTEIKKLVAFSLEFIIAYKDSVV